MCDHFSAFSRLLDIFKISILAILMVGNLLPLFYFAFSGYQREGSILISLRVICISYVIVLFL